MTTTTSTAWTVTVNTKFGSKSLETRLDVKQAIQILATTPNSSQFASDLVRNFGRYGLSTNQANWAIYLAQEVLDKQNKPKSSVNPVTIDTKSLFTLFATAHLNLKYPRLRLQTADGRLVVIKLSGQNSKHCGSLNLTNGVKYGDNGAVFYGFIHQDGSTTIKDQSVLNLINMLANDPAGVAASQGLASGECCCCGKALSDSEDGSSEIGYGPQCAKSFGLPWSSNKQVDKVKKTRKSKKSQLVA